MIRITQLKIGDVVLGWMRTGFALKKGRHPNGKLYRFVPSRPDRFDQDDLQQFTGIVTHNDTVNCVLRVEACRMNSKTMPVSEAIQSEMHYGALHRMRRLSKVAYAARPQSPLRPGNIAIGTGGFPYRTIEEVQLLWK